MTYDVFKECEGKKYTGVQVGGRHAQILVRVAEEEHLTAKTLLGELSHLSISDATFDAKRGSLNDRILKHAKAEESERFPRFSDLDRNRRKSISERWAAGKRELAPGMA